MGPALRSAMMAAQADCGSSVAPHAILESTRRILATTGGNAATPVRTSEGLGLPGPRDARHWSATATPSTTKTPSPFTNWRLFNLRFLYPR
jgi:hypothetical protein